MFKKYVLSIVLMLILSPLSSWSMDKDCFPKEMIPDNLFPVVKLETSMGDVEVELNRMRAPITVNNFLRYVLEGEHDGTIFHLREGEYRICSQERHMSWFQAAPGSSPEPSSERPPGRRNGPSPPSPRPHCTQVLAKRWPL